MTTVYPFSIHLWRFDITGYGIMLMVGFLVGGWLIGIELERRGLYKDYAADITLAAAIGGIVGAKVWFAVINGDLGMLVSRGGLVWYGGLLGGAIGVLFNGRRLGVPFRWTMHLCAPALAAAYALGRVGCFIVNDDYGRPTTLPWGVKFPLGLPPSTAANMQSQFGIPVPVGVDPNTVLAVHPTQLYEVIIMLGVFALLWTLRSRGKPIGWLFGVYLVLAGCERFMIEFLRAKDDRYFGPFTLAQVTSMILITIGVILWVRWGSGASPEPGRYLQGGQDGQGGQAAGVKGAAGTKQEGRRRHR